MDGVSLGLSVLTTFKELYLISKFIHRTFSSVKNSKAEREDLEEEFYHEVLYLQSFGQLIVTNDGLLMEGNMNSAWLQRVYSILERLRLQCSDYAKVAAAQDDEYRVYSPYLHPSIASSKVIEFTLDLKPHIPTPTSPAKGRRKYGFGWLLSSRPTANWDSWMWALFERRKFERFLCEFRAKTQKIKELVPLILALHPQYNNSLILEKLIANEHSNRVGMAPHARLRRLTINPATDTTDFLLNDVSLCALLESESVSVANLTDKTLTASGAQLEPERVLVEFKKYGEEADTVEEAAPDLVTKNRVHQLACLLSSAGRDGLHTLSLRGLIYQPAQSRYAFLFDFPVVAQECDPISLWTLIESTSSKSRLTLPQRFQVARYVATALSAFHVDGWVHKSIRSQSIVFFHNANDPSATLSADCYLVDFEFARPENAETQHTFDNHLEKNLYRHPDRQGTPTISFQKHHDIYSLGVVLLEIGLWMTASHIYQNATARMKTGVLMNPRGIRNLYIDIANRKLPHNMGPAYRGAVVKCLSGGFQETDTDLTMEFYEEVVQSIDVFKLA